MQAAMHSVQMVSSAGCCHQLASGNQTVVYSVLSVSMVSPVLESDSDEVGLSDSGSLGYLGCVPCFQQHQNGP